ncbi:MAG: RagB/SusD family nutrient uptake outer membrane protein [Cyclobacteriaceae bacterium]
MKRCNYILLSLSLILMLSCDGQLDIVPQDVLATEIAITSLDDLETALLGAYATLRRNGLYERAFVMTPDALADNLRIGDSNGGTLRIQANWDYTSGSDSDIGTWEDAYVLIFRANTVISNADRFEDGSKKNRIVGQALALRALGHFDLLRYYAPDYNRNSTEPGVPVVTFFEIGKPSRNTVSEVYDQIFSDLSASAVALGDVDAEIESPAQMDLRAVNALQARVSLYAEEWQDAIDFASSVISASSLANAADYANMWSDDFAADELLFTVVFASRDEGQIGSRLYDDDVPTQITASLPLSSDMALLYDQVNDVRYSSFVLDNRALGNTDAFILFKYSGRNGERGLHNAKVLRTSEMYLIRAEAYTNLPGQDIAAMADLNALRASRISGYVNENLTGTALVEAIALERRKELVAEGHRWFDLRRTGGDVVRGGECAASALTTNCNLFVGDVKFTYPIPLDEVLANPNIEQNTGY